MSTSVRHWIFVRHAHPISAWSRWASTPLLLVPLWWRRGWMTLPIAAWMVVNPVITPPPSNDRAFATRAILGEEQWIAHPAMHRDLVALNALSAASLVMAVIAAYWLRPVPMAVAMAGSMAFILITWRGYAHLYDSRRKPVAPRPRIRSGAPDLQ
jgi:hypothetical protein